MSTYPALLYIGDVENESLETLDDHLDGHGQMLTFMAYQMAEEHDGTPTEAISMNP